MDNPVFEKRVELILVDSDGEMTKSIRLSQSDINNILEGLASLPYRTDSILCRISEAKRWFKK